MVDLRQHFRAAARSLVRRIRPAPTALPVFSDKLNFGCGHEKKPGYLNVDRDPDCRPDLLLENGDVSTIPRKAFREVLAIDVIEHVGRARTLGLLLDFNDFLLPSGRLIVETSSILDAADKLRAATTFAEHYSWTICLFGNQVHAGDFHYSGFTELTLRVHLLAAGFRVARCEIRKDWLLYAEATKEVDWTEIDNNCSDREFVRRVYVSAFGREPSRHDIEANASNLSKGASRKGFARDVFSSFERLCVIAQRHGV